MRLYHACSSLSCQRVTFGNAERKPRRLCVLVIPFVLSHMFLFCRVVIIASISKSIMWEITEYSTTNQPSVISKNWIHHYWGRDCFHPLKDINELFGNRGWLVKKISDVISGRRKIEAPVFVVYRIIDRYCLDARADRPQINGGLPRRQGLLREKQEESILLIRIQFGARIVIVKKIAHDSLYHSNPQTLGTTSARNRPQKNILRRLVWKFTLPGRLKPYSTNFP